MPQRRRPIIQNRRAWAWFLLAVAVVTGVLLYARIRYSTQQDQFDKEIEDRLAEKASAEHQDDPASGPQPNSRQASTASPEKLSASNAGLEPTANAKATHPISNFGATGQVSEQSDRATITPPPKSQKDLGVDLAIPVSRAFSLMEEPNSSSAQIKRVTDHDTLVLIDREPEHGWYDVIDVRSGKEGWVNENDVRISPTKHPIPEAKFSEEYVGSDDAPEVTVTNQTNGDLSLKIGGSYYTLKPKSQLPVPLSNGTFSYYATEPGVIPLMGSQLFKRGHRYTWRFWVESTLVRFP